MRRLPPESGYILNFEVAGIGIYVHWSFPVAGVVLAFMLGDTSPPTMISLAVAYTLLVLLHEAGHAVFARRAGCKVHALVITAGGGACFAEMPAKRRDRLLLFSGGLLAQVLLFVATVAALVFAGSPTSQVGGSFALVFTVVNAVIFVANLIPSADNDGAMIARTLLKK